MASFDPDQQKPGILELPDLVFFPKDSQFQPWPRETHPKPPGPQVHTGTTLEPAPKAPEPSGTNPATHTRTNTGEPPEPSQNPHQNRPQRNFVEPPGTIPERAPGTRTKGCAEPLSRVRTPS